MLNPSDIFQWHPDAVLRTATRSITATDAEEMGHQKRNTIQATSETQIIMANAADPIQAMITAFAAIHNNRRFCITGERLGTDGHMAISADVRTAAPCFVTLSGGTTGAPKSIERTHASWIYSFEKLQAQDGTSHGDVVATLGGMQHSLTLYAVIEALHLGATADIGTLSDRATVAYVTPVLLKLFLRANPPRPNLRRLLIGGGAVDAPLLAACQNHFPNAEILTFYGASETSFIALNTSPHGNDDAGTLFDGVTVNVDPDGELWINSPMMFERYLGPNEGTEVHQNGYLSLKECGSLDTHGRLTVLGRMDRVVRISDQSVSLDALELKIMASAAFENVAALPQPDILRGTSLIIAVSGNPPDDLRYHIPKGLPIRTIVPIHDWPLLPSGKTDYLTLTDIVKTLIP